MTYEEFKQLATGKSADEIMRIVNDNLTSLNLRDTYYNTYKIFTEDGVALVKGGSVDNAQAPARLLNDAYKLSSDYAEAQKAVEGINPRDLIGKFIWGKNAIMGAKQADGKIVITLNTGKVYSFRDIKKLMSLVA